MTKPANARKGGSAARAALLSAMQPPELHEPRVIRLADLEDEYDPDFTTDPDLANEDEPPTAPAGQGPMVLDSDTAIPTIESRRGERPVHAALGHHVEQHPGVERYCVAYSGGMDSHVLLHVAVDLLGTDDAVHLRAIHVDHGLNEDSDEWARHAATVAQSIGVPLTVRRVMVTDTGEGPEAAARAARYAAFAAELQPGEHLLLAQHAGDQAETFLLQALRGSGPDGLASIPRKRPFAAGVMARPLLGCPQAALAEVAAAAKLSWVEDPGNGDLAFDRNYLRREIMPRLEARWPAATRTLGRTALRSAAASHTLLGLAQEDLGQVRVRGAKEISVSELRTLTRERAYNVIRLWVRQAGLRMPRLQDLAQVLETLVRAREDTRGIVGTRDYEFRRYRDRLFLLPPHTETTRYEHEWLAPYDDLPLPEIGLVLSRDACIGQGIALPTIGRVTVRSRRGGELIRLGEPAFHKAVKKLLQESGVPPWRRDAIPLIYIDDRLAAVWNLAVAVDFRARPATVPDVSV